MRWKKIIGLFMLIFALCAGIWYLVGRMEREAPSLSFAEELSFIGKSTGWTLVAEDRKSGLRQMRVWVRQGPKMEEVLARDFPAAGWKAGAGVHRKEETLVFDPKKLGLSDGGATVIVAAQDNSLWNFKGNSVFQEFPVVVDTIAPRIDLLSTVHNVKKGGTGLVVFRLREEPEKAGIMIGEIFYPAYPEESAGEGIYLVYFAIDPDADAGLVPVLTARDKAGNEARRTVPTRIADRKFPRDTIRISEGFLTRKMPEFQAADPTLSSDRLEAYLTVNSEWRKRNHERLKEVCAQSHPRRLWSGAFMQMKNTQNMSPYAVKRNYLYQGKRVDQQVHLGLDLASTAGADVPAANAGVVVLAGDLGIYGQTVVIDHGQGLFSLYSHLSGIFVSEGETVGRGQTVGSSGQTGMAGGDHLHFSIMVSGEFVNPIEWLDAHWIEDNIENKLGLLNVSPDL